MRKKKIVYDAEFNTVNAEKSAENLTESFKKSGDEAKKSTDKAQEGLENNEEAIGSVTGAADKMTGGLIAGFRGAVSGIKTGVTAFKTLKGAIIATGIGALLVAFGSLVSFFTKTQRGAELLEQASAALGASFDVLVDRVSSFGETIVSAFQDPQQAIQDFGNLLKDFVMNRVNDVINGFTGLGKTVKLIFEGEFAEAFEAGKEAAADLVTGFVPIAGVVKDNADEIKGLVDEIKEESSASLNLQKRLQSLERQEIDYIKTKAEKRRAIEAARLAAEDENKTDEERAASLQRAIDLQSEITDQEIQFAKERADIITQQVALGESLNEDLQRQAQAEAEVINLESQRDRQLRSLQTRLNAFTNNTKEDTKATEDNAEAKKLAAEQKKMLADIRIQNIRDENERELAELDLKFERMREKAKGNNELLTEIDTQYDMQVEALENAQEKRRDDIRQKEIDDAKKQADELEAIEEAKGQAKIQVAQMVLGATSSFLKEGSDIAKGVAVAQTTIETFKSAQAAYASVVGVPVVGPVLAPIAAASAVAAGIANVRSILSTNPMGGTGTPSAPNVSGAGGSVGNAGASAPSITPGQQFGASDVDPSEALRRGDNAQQPLRAYVLEGNVTSAQEAQGKIQEQAVL